jgi:hypothetical protein
MKKNAIKWRVKHEPAKTVYEIRCHDIITLTVGYGEPLPPRYTDSFAGAERRDVPEHWALWGRHGSMGWRQSTHDTKEAARAALRANRLAPPKPPVNRWSA